MTNTFGITARAYRWFSDGTEAGMTAVANENTSYSANVGSGDLNLVLRYGVQESGSGSASGATTDDYQLQYSTNGGGAWNNVTGASSVVRGYDSSNLTDAGAASTQLLSSGTGSFISGEISEDGLLDDWQLTANNHSELVYTVRVLQSGATNGQSVTFRVLRNGAVFNTYSVTPTLTVDTTKLVSHTASVVALAGGGHVVSTRRVHTASVIAITGGTHTASAAGPPSPKPVDEVGRRVFGSAAPFQDEAGSRVFASSTTGRNEAGAFVSNLPAAAGTPNNVSHTASVIAFSGGSHFLIRKPSHTGGNVVFGGGAHVVTTRRSHTASVVAFAGGTQAAVKGYRPSHTAAAVAIAGGTHTTQSNYRRAETASVIAIAGGAHAVTTSRTHTASVVAFGGGTHTQRHTNVAAHTASVIALAGGSHATTRTTTETASVVVISGGTHTAQTSGGSQNYTVTHAASVVALAGGSHALRRTQAETAANVAFAGGSHFVRRTTSETASSIVIAGGTHTQRHTNVVGEVAGQVAFAGGSQSLIRKPSHTAAQITLAGGTSHVDRRTTHTAPEILFGGGQHFVPGDNVAPHTAAGISITGGDHGLFLTVGSGEGGGFVRPAGPFTDKLIGNNLRPPLPVKIKTPIFRTVVINAGHIAIVGGEHGVDHEDMALLLMA